MHRGGAGADGEDVLRLEVGGQPLLEQRRARARSSASPSGASRRRRRSPPRRSREAGSRAGCYGASASTRKRTASAARRARASASSRSAPVASTAPARSAPRRSGAEDVAGPAVDPDPLDAVARLRLVDALDGHEHARRWHEEDDAAACRRGSVRAALADTVSREGSPRARTRSRARSGRRRAPPGRAPRRGRRRGAPRPPSRPARPGRAAPACTTARFGSRAPRPRRAAPRRGPAVSCSDGQTCASATPNAGGSAVSRSVTVSGCEVAVDRERVDGHLGPVDELLDEHAAAARLGGRDGERLRELLRAPRRASARAAPAGRAP